MMAAEKYSRGFTLIEIMIVVALVGLMASIAYPSYKDSVLKGRRAQGRTAVVELLQQQERYMTQRNCYLGFTTDAATGVATATAPGTACGGVTASAVPFKTFSGDTLTNSHYILSAAACSTSMTIATCVKVTATPKQADPAVGDLSMTSTGTKDCTGSTKSLCWP